MISRTMHARIRRLEDRAADPLASTVVDLRPLTADDQRQLDQVPAAGLADPALLTLPQLRALARVRIVAVD